MKSRYVMNEVVWKAVNLEPYGEVYEVSNLGEVRNKLTGKVLKLFPNERGYLRVRLVKDKKAFGTSIHRLVMMSFCPVDGMEGLEVDHIDGDKSNNSLSNLRWVTHEENLSNQEEVERRELRKAETKARHEKEKAERKALRHAQALENRKKRRKEYYQAHKEEERARNKEWKEANREKMAQFKKDWREANRDKVNAYMRDYNSKNKERLAAQEKARRESMSAEELQALKDKKRAYDRERYLRRKGL